MSAISSAVHQQLLLKSRKQMEVLGTEAKAEMLQDVQKLEILYSRYQHKLSTLKKLIDEYQVMNKRVRIALRKEHIRQKQKQFI